MYRRLVYNIKLASDQGRQTKLSLITTQNEHSIKIKHMKTASDARPDRLSMIATSCDGSFAHEGRQLVT